MSANIQTPDRIRTTVFDTIACNYIVVLVDDAVGTSLDEVHRGNVREITNIWVSIVKAAEVPGLLD